MRICHWLFALPFSLFALINSNGDYQLWQRSHFRHYFTKNGALVVTTEVRIGDDVSKFYYCYLQPQILYSPAEWISIAPGYRQAAKRFPTNSNHWIPEYIPMCDLTFFCKLKGWQFEDRSRFEYILSKASHYPWLYRNRFRVFLPIHWTRCNMTPYLDNEIFWRQADGINEDRASIGLRQTFSPSIYTDTSYIARFLKATPHWVHQNVFLLRLSVKY